MTGLRLGTIWSFTDAFLIGLEWRLEVFVEPVVAFPGETVEGKAGAVGGGVEIVEVMGFAEIDGLLNFAVETNVTDSQTVGREKAECVKGVAVGSPRNGPKFGERRNRNEFGLAPL